MANAKNIEYLEDEPNRVVILGAGAAGLAMLELLLQEDLVEVVAIVDHDAAAPGLVRARELGIQIFQSVGKALHACAPCIAFNLTADEKAEAEASNILGAGGVIGGLEAKLIWKMVTNLREAKERLEFQAAHDELTGLYNRRHMLSELERELSHAMRYDVPLSVVMIDLDKFKSVNDAYGHAAGDAALRHVSKLLKKHARASDVIGRWGGEEFLALLPHNTLSSASHAVAKWLESLRRKPFMTPAGEPLEISFSAGIADFRKEDAIGSFRDLTDRLLARADDRLYVAKNTGRGRIVCGD